MKPRKVNLIPYKKPDGLVLVKTKDIVQIRDNQEADNVDEESGPLYNAKTLNKLLTHIFN